jgi:DNA-binding CsgD family transcriptional regulator
MNKPLSPREEEIVDLCISGLTNEAIAIQLGLSIGTINTYWLRIKIKFGGQGKTETIARVIQKRADGALKKSDLKLREITGRLLEREREVVELRAALALLHHSMDRIGSTVWATDEHLIIHITSRSDVTAGRFAPLLEVGKSVYEVFRTDDSKHPPVAAHLTALDGIECSVNLGAEYENQSLHVVPLRDDNNLVLGCVSMIC